MIEEKDLLDEINDLLKRPPNSSNCEKLATLFVIHDHLYRTESLIEPENGKEVPETNRNYSRTSGPDGEILPAYFSYIEAKKAYQYGDVPKEKVLRTFDDLSFEIKEFIKILYRNTDMPEERQKLSNLIQDIKMGNM